jgi:thermitase
MKNKLTFAIFISLGVLGLVMGLIAALNLNNTPDDGRALPTLAQLATQQPLNVAAAATNTETPPPDTATVTPTVQNTVETASAPASQEAPEAFPTVELAGTILLEAVAVPEQIIIHFDSAASTAERQRYIREIGGVAEGDIDGLDSVVVNFPAQNAPETLPETDFVLHSEPNYYVSALQFAPNDPLSEQQWALSVIGLPEAWQGLQAIETGAVVVAVVDSGICDHEDLTDRVIGGYDFVEDDAAPQDEFGHGCAVAGIIAANSDNGIGITGGAPNTQIMPLRVLDAQGLGTYANVARALVYATDQGADIINVSLGGAADAQTLRSAIDYAVSHGVMVIAAAGNSGQTNALFPAAYPDVIAVGSVDSSLQPSHFSNHGPMIDLWGPGSHILSTAANNSYKLFSGTSFASPYVSAVAAMEMHLGRTLVIHGDIATVGGMVQTITPNVPAIPVSHTSETDPALTLFLPTDAQGALNADAVLGATRSRYTEINFEALSNTLQSDAQSLGQTRITLNLFEDTSLTATFRESQSHAFFEDGFVWQGDIPADIHGEATLVVGEGQISGHVSLDGQLYRIAYAGNGVHGIYEVDADSYRRPHLPPAMPVEEGEEQGWAYSPEASANNLAIIDLMVVYSPAARQHLAMSGIMNDIQLSVILTNQIFKNSGVNARFNLVHAQEISMTEQATLYDDLYTMSVGAGWGATVHTMRNLYGADLVTLVTDTDPYASCGIGWVMERPNAANNQAYGYNVVEASCLWNGITMAHEIGHNMGLAHDRANAAVAGAYPYAYGYADPQGRFVTVMSYTNNCIPGRGCVQLGRFSSPNQSIGDLPLGTQNTDNVRALNNTAHGVANFRNNVIAAQPTPTPQPSLLDPPGTPVPNSDTFECHYNVASGNVEQLRTAIHTVNQLGLPEVRNICLDSGTYTVTNAPYTIDPAIGMNAFPVITANMRIIGNGSVIQRQGNTLFRFFQLDMDAQLVLVDLTLQNGYVSNSHSGGAVDAWGGVISLNDSTLINNTAGWGGAISNGLFIELLRSELTGNVAVYGGAIYTEADMNITYSFISENYSSSLRGAIDSRMMGGLIVESCIINNAPVAVHAEDYLMAPQNWWGSPNGPTLLDNEGLEALHGDVISGNVDYTPFYTEPVPACSTRPTGVQLVSPAVNNIHNNALPEFVWSPLADVSSYQLQLSQESAFEQGVRTISQLTEPRLQLEAPALEGGIWYWRVRANVNGRSGPWSETRRFTLDLIPPTVPILSAPVDLLSTTNTRPTFTWLRNPDVAEYEIQLDRVNPPEATWSSTVPSFRPNGLVIGTYYWRVRGRDAVGNWSDWSDIRQLSVDSPANALPQRNYYVMNTPTLTWSRMPWALLYQVEVSTVANFRTVVMREDVNRQQLEATTSPLDNGVYYWRVRAQMANGRWGAWSLTESFTVDAP